MRRLTILLSHSNAPPHLEHPRAAFGIAVERMPDGPVLRLQQTEAFLNLRNTWPHFVNEEQKNPCTLCR